MQFPRRVGRPFVDWKQTLVVSVAQSEKARYLMTRFADVDVQSQDRQPREHFLDELRTVLDNGQGQKDLADVLRELQPVIRRALLNLEKGSD